MKKEKKPKRKPGKLPTYTFFSMLIFFSGLIIAGLTVFLVKSETQAQLRSTLLTVGGVLAGIGLILVIIAIAIYRYYDRHPELTQPVSERVIERVVEKTVVTSVEPSAAEPLPEAKGKPEVMPDAVAHLDNPTTSIGTNVKYIPSMEAYEFINMGSYQTLEEKFNQISQMDHTQFVIYVARLFSRKGYQVKLTPVVDNYGIDLIVEKMGVAIAVCCLLSNKVLCKEDITFVCKGKDHYYVQNCMALTNMYFDRTALDFARAEKMSLVDRNILAEDFMN
ncbi:MAG: restriction endonuclease [Clostridiales bacterium]|nr:restriction endonuclease [Clostridiales bacterium]